MSKEVKRIERTETQSTTDSSFNEHKLHEIEMHALKAQAYAIAGRVFASLEESPNFKKLLDENLEYKAILAAIETQDVFLSFELAPSEIVKKSLDFETLTNNEKNEFEQKLTIHFLNNLLIKIADISKTCTCSQYNELSLIVPKIVQSISADFKNRDTVKIYIKVISEIITDPKNKDFMQEWYQRASLEFKACEQSFAPVEITKSAAAIAYIYAEYLKQNYDIAPFVSYEIAKQYYFNNYLKAKELYIDFVTKRSIYEDQCSHLPKYAERRQEVFQAEVSERLKQVPTKYNTPDRIFNEASIDTPLNIYLIQKTFDEALKYFQNTKRYNSLFFTMQNIFYKLLDTMKKEFFNDISFFDPIFKSLKGEHEDRAYLEILKQFFSNDENIILADEDKHINDEEISAAISAHEERLKILLAFKALAQSIVTVKAYLSESQMLAATFVAYEFYNRFIPQELVMPLSQSIRKKIYNLTALNIIDTVVSNIEVRFEKNKNTVEYWQKEKELQQKLATHAEHPEAYGHPMHKESKIIQRVFPAFNKQELVTENSEEFSVYVQYLSQVSELSLDESQWIDNNWQSFLKEVYKRDINLTAEWIDIKFAPLLNEAFKKLEKKWQELNVPNKVSSPLIGMTFMGKTYIRKKNSNIVEAAINFCLFYEIEIKLFVSKNKDHTEISKFESIKKIYAKAYQLNELINNNPKIQNNSVFTNAVMQRMEALKPSPVRVPSK